jgi:hypothetical protein
VHHDRAAQAVAVQEQGRALPGPLDEASYVVKDLMEGGRMAPRAAGSAVAAKIASQKGKPGAGEGPGDMLIPADMFP